MSFKQFLILAIFIVPLIAERRDQKDTDPRKLPYWDNVT